MVFFKKYNYFLLLEYESDRGIAWVRDKFDKYDTVTLRKVYTFTKSDIHEDEDTVDSDDFNTEGIGASESITFTFATLDEGYYRIKGRILSIEKDLYICDDFTFRHNIFAAHRNISIFRKIERQIDENIWIGRDEKSNLPVSEFERLIKLFPNSTELDKYADARINSVIHDYFDTTQDKVASYEKYMNKKISRRGENLIDTFGQYEKAKYVRVLDKLTQMLQEQEMYNEKQWQREILQILLILYPKYLCVFDEVTIRDSRNNANRSLDFMLVDANGNVDVVEIKRPFDKKIMSQNTYRDNHVPLRELSGSVMQIEKYIYYLCSWGHNGEKTLTERYSTGLPKNLRIHIVNPGGIVIMGRDHELSEEQRADFEIVKRKYRNVIDIITYDDLIHRLELQIERFS